MSGCLPAAEVYVSACAGGALSLADGAQSLPHFKDEVQIKEATSSHFRSKSFAPTGMGTLYKRSDLLDRMSSGQRTVACLKM
ncbi:MAG: aminotransferase class V-fold PLP-dependent enzyme [Alphaproteobacteria bacterium]|nr:aminotransferase class V-fold PLP-dependent enzyme [Alphaproteobacteria bacterium]